MQKAFEDFFSQYFENQGNNFPNPFDNEAFAQFISDQIKTAVPSYQGSANESQGDRMQNMPNSNQNSPGQRRHSPKQGEGNAPHSPGNTQSQSHDIKYNVFETHDFVIARIAMPNVIPDLKKSILLNSHELFLKVEGRQKPVLQINLPKPVNAKKTKATTRNGILEIQMLKRPPEPLSEFEISEILQSTDNEFM